MPKKNEIYDIEDFMEICPIDWKEVDGIDANPLDIIYSGLINKYEKRFLAVKDFLYWTSNTNKKYDKHLMKYIKYSGMLEDKTLDHKRYVAESTRIAPIAFLKKPKWAKDNALYLMNSVEIMKINELVKEEKED